MIYIVNFILLCIVLSVSCLSDIKFRLIPNPIFHITIIFSIYFNITEGIIHLNALYYFIVIKALFLFISSTISFILFLLNFIGAGDGKLVIMSFALIPFKYIFPFFIYFPLFLSFFLIYSAYIYDICNSEKKFLHFKTYYLKKNQIALIINEKERIKLDIFPLSVPYILAYFCTIILNIAF